MPRGLKVSRLLIANMIPSININNIIYILTFIVAHLDMLDDSLAF